MSVEILFKEESDLNDPSIDTVFDLAERCRTCLRHECSLTPINSSDSDSIKFCDKLAACVSGVKWAKEGVPSFICGPCIEKLRIAHDFQIVCLQSDQALQLQDEKREIRSSTSVTPDPTTTTDRAECDKTIENVILSIKAEETQIQPLPQWPCRMCNKSFVTSSRLTQHMRRHTGKKFSCKLCDKKFTYPCSLKIHMKTHIGEKISCKLCDKKYNQACSLNVHMRRYTGEMFSCKLCDKKFTQSCSLNAHMRIHTGDKPWRCQTCNKSYIRSSYLTEHMKTHTGKISCKLCDKKFNRASYFFLFKCTYEKTYWRLTLTMSNL